MQFKKGKPYTRYPPPLGLPDILPLWLQIQRSKMATAETIEQFAGHNHLENKKQIVLEMTTSPNLEQEIKLIEHIMWP